MFQKHLFTFQYQLTTTTHMLCCISQQFGQQWQCSFANIRLDTDKAQHAIECSLLKVSSFWTQGEFYLFIYFPPPSFFYDVCR